MPTFTYTARALNGELKHGDDRRADRATTSSRSCGASG